MSRMRATVVVVVLPCTAAAMRLPGPRRRRPKVLQAYEEAWSRHDAHAVAGFYYEPAVRVARGGPVMRLKRADQEAFFSGFLRGLVGRGYACSAREHLEVRLLDAETAIASGVTGRYRSGRQRPEADRARPRLGGRVASSARARRQAHQALRGLGPEVGLRAAPATT